MGKFNNTRKFEKRDSDRSERQEFTRSSGHEKRNFSKYGKSKDFDRDDSDSKDSGFKLYQAICDKCGRECDVPFKPTGNKPIYCRACFRANESGGGTDRRSESRFNDKSNSSDLDKINRKLDKIMKALRIE